MEKICIELYNGDKINLGLYPEVAPITVANFLKLVDEHYFDMMIFHRIIKGFMSQGGGYELQRDNTIVEKRAEAIPGEFKANGFKNNLQLHHGLGVISMARTNDPNSASSQFFLCSTNALFLDDNYASFGEALDKESIINMEKLNSIPTTTFGMMADFPNTDITNITIKTITRI